MRQRSSNLQQLSKKSATTLKKTYDNYRTAVRTIPKHTRTIFKPARPISKPIRTIPKLNRTISGYQNVLPNQCNLCHSYYCILY